MGESENYSRYTKAELVELLEKNLTKKDLKMSDVGYNPAIDFPEREQHHQAKREKQRIFNLTKGKGIKSIQGAQALKQNRVDKNAQ